ncbi:MAG: IS21 family transposase [Gaiellales bacterium]
MNKVKRMLELQATGLGVREISRVMSVSVGAVSGYLAQAKVAGLVWPLPAELADEEFMRRLVPPHEPAAESVLVMPDLRAVHAAKHAQKGVTMQLLHAEYAEDLADRAYSYNRFCELYRDWQGRIEPTMLQPHPPGERSFIDYAGVTIAIVEQATGEVRDAQVFVASLGASSYSYCEASWSQSMKDFTASHIRMFEHLGAAPQILVPDNLKSAITTPNRYEPRINAVYDDLAQHYGCVVIPARVVKPQDKAKVERAVQLVERHVLAPLRNRTFFTLAEANRAMRPLMDALNDKPMRMLDVSRRELLATVDRPAMRALPKQRWQRCEFGTAKVGPNYHVAFDKHRYSVPYKHIGAQVDVRATADIIELLTGGVRIASHPRSFVKGAFTTTPAHMPSTHRAHAEWTPERLMRWATDTAGVATSKVVELVMASQRHPELGFNAALGIMRLGSSKRYGPDRLEAACVRAVATGCATYKSIESILKGGLDSQPIETANVVTLPMHPNVRGADYYQPELPNPGPEGDAAC